MSDYFFFQLIFKVSKMSDDNREDIKKRLTSIGHIIASAMKKTFKIVEEFHYLININAAEELDCKETELINFIDCDEESKLTLYRCLTQAHIEVDIKVLPNTLRQSWTRKMSSAANKLKLEPDARKDFLIQVHKQSKRIAGGSGKVNINHIKAAIEYSTALITPTEDDSDTQELQINTELVSSLLLEVRHPSVSNRIKTIRILLNSSDDLNVLFKKLSSLPGLTMKRINVPMAVSLMLIVSLRKCSTAVIHLMTGINCSKKPKAI